MIFKLDNEYFCYRKGDKQISIDIKDLINLKNKINIQPENKNNNNEEEIEEKKDVYQIKCDKLIFFKNIISNLEVIYDKMKILRIKGYNIPILIKIEIEYPNIVYKFNTEDEEEKDFNYIKNYKIIYLQ